MDKAAPTLSSYTSALASHSKSPARIASGGKANTHNGIKFGQEDPIDTSLPRGAAYPRAGEVLKRPVEFRELVHCLVPYEGFADKDDLVRVIHRHELIMSVGRG